MARIIYVNGSYKQYEDAQIHVEDRGFQFADGVYEVCEVKQKCLVDETRHIERLQRSLKELKMELKISISALGIIMRETIRRNHVINGLVYIQITRGKAKRDFIFPPKDTPLSIVCFARKVSPRINAEKALQGISVITTPEIRWKRPDIKSVALLPNALAKQAAYEQGCQEAWFVDEEGFITEGSSSNAWIITQDDLLLTRHAESGILKGITRSVIIDLLNREGIEFKEQAFTLQDVIDAKEAFITSASTVIMPVVRINGTLVNNGNVGSIVTMLRKQFHTQAELKY